MTMRKDDDVWTVVSTDTGSSVIIVCYRHSGIHTHIKRLSAIGHKVYVHRYFVNVQVDKGFI